jgi:hypothetical protein
VLELQTEAELHERGTCIGHHRWLNCQANSAMHVAASSQGRDLLPT